LALTEANWQAIAKRLDIHRIAYVLSRNVKRTGAGAVAGPFPSGHTDVISVGAVSR
jgi:hypothetical protein